MAEDLKRKLTWSYGGGTQSIAIAVLIAQEKLPRPDCIVIADTGREASETWEYLSDYVQPLLARAELTVEIAPHSLATVDLYSHKGELLLPVFTKTGKLQTFCSSEWKASVIRRFLRSKGYGKDNPVRTWIGISLDEIGRARPQKNPRWQDLHWPLLLDVEPAMTRADCRRLILNAGLPNPPKSSCWMCPHRRNEQWQHLKTNYPNDWERAVKLDQEIREKDKRGGVWLHRDLMPLSEIDLTPIEKPESPLFGQVDGCDSGYCYV